MSDHANVGFKSAKGTIWVYTHKGTNLASTLKAALEDTEDHWDDPAFLTKMITDELVYDAITLTRQDNTRNIIEVDLDAQTVSILSNAHWHDEDDDAWARNRDVLATWTWGEFTSATCDQINAAYHKVYLSL